MRNRFFGFVAYVGEAEGLALALSVTAVDHEVMFFAQNAGAAARFIDKLRDDDERFRLLRQAPPPRSCKSRGSRQHESGRRFACLRVNDSRKDAGSRLIAKSHERHVVASMNPNA
jgi:hypothetical protein